VLVSNVLAKHGSEMRFLRLLEEKLQSPTITVNDLAEEVSKRISALEAGNPDPDETLPGSATTAQDEQALGRSSSPPGMHDASYPSRSGSDSTPDKTPGYAATVTLESLAWGRHYGGCYPHRRCNCYSYRTSSEIISIRSDLSDPASNFVNPASSITTTLTSDTGVLPSIQDSVKLVKFHISHLAWHHGLLHTPTFLEQCELFWSTGTYRHPLWLALYLSVLTVRASRSPDSFSQANSPSEHHMVYPEQREVAGRFGHM
jgi:hypothetical protein